MAAGQALLAWIACHSEKPFGVAQDELRAEDSGLGRAIEPDSSACPPSADVVGMTSGRYPLS